MKTPKQRKIIWAGLAIFAVSCGGTALNPQLDGDQTKMNLGLRVQANTSKITGALMNSLVDAQNLIVSSGQACVQEIELELPKGLSCADVGFVRQSNVTCIEEMDEEDDDGTNQLEAKIKIQGPYVFDLVTGKSTPSLDDVIIPSGIYREIEFEFEDACSFDKNATIVLQGDMKDSSEVNHPFEFYLEYEDDLEIESSTDVQVLEEKSNEIFANIVLNQWFSAVNFVQCIDDGDLVATAGVIQISKETVATGQCEDIYDRLLDTIKDAFEFEDHGFDD